VSGGSLAQRARQGAPSDGRFEANFRGVCPIWKQTQGSADWNLTQIIELYPAHVWKEDYLLLPITDKILSDTDQESLAREFEQYESEIGSDVHHGFEQLAESLVARIHAEEGSAAVSAAA